MKPYTHLQAICIKLWTKTVSIAHERSLWGSQVGLAHGHEFLGDSGAEAAYRCLTSLTVSMSEICLQISDALGRARFAMESWKHSQARWPSVCSAKLFLRIQTRILMATSQLWHNFTSKQLISAQQPGILERLAVREIAKRVEAELEQDAFVVT